MSPGTTALSLNKAQTQTKALRVGTSPRGNRALKGTSRKVAVPWDSFCRSGRKIVGCRALRAWEMCACVRVAGRS